MILDSGKNFVSRAGTKLQAALEQFAVGVKNKTVLDVGSSTGGFVDCLLQNGAKKVYAVETGYGLLDWRLRNDKRVAIMEKTNILYLKNLPESVDLITIDTSWTKLEKVLPAAVKFLKPEGIIIALLKPHYEAEKKVLRKGIVPRELVEEIRDNVLKRIKALGFEVEQAVESPILGRAGNKEFLLKIILCQK